VRSSAADSSGASVAESSLKLCAPVPAPFRPRR
jgi:hypothetical protein